MINRQLSREEREQLYHRYLHLKLDPEEKALLLDLLNDPEYQEEFRQFVNFDYELVTVLQENALSRGDIPSVPRRTGRKRMRQVSRAPAPSGTSRRNPYLRSLSRTNRPLIIPLLSLCAAGLLLFLSYFLLVQHRSQVTSPQQSQITAPQQAPITAPQSIATVTSLHGKRMVYALSNGRQRIVHEHDSLYVGETVHIPKQSLLDLRYQDGSQLTFQGPASFTLAAKDQQPRVNFLTGRLSAHFGHQPVKEPFRIGFPQGQIQILGTVLDVFASASTTKVLLLQGKIKITRRGDPQQVVLPSGSYAEITANTTEPITIHKLASPDRRHPLFFIEAETFDRTASPRYQNTQLALQESVISGKTCLDIGQSGVRISRHITLLPGTWYLLLRYRDDNERPLTAHIELNGKVLQKLTTPGREKRWLWAKIPFRIQEPGLYEIALVTETPGLPANDKLRYSAWACAHRWDIMAFTKDPAFVPSQDPPYHPILP